MLSKFISILWTIITGVLSLFSTASTPTVTTESRTKIVQTVSELELEVPECLETGTFSQAVKAARQKGRFLVALTTTKSPTAIQCLLSDEVIKVANRKSKKISPNGSFLFWIGDDDAARSVGAGKLCVLASPSKILGTSAPPKTSKGLAKYLNDIRQRNRKLLLALNKRLQEKVWAEERRQNYQESIVSDDQKRHEQAQRIAEQTANAAAAAAHAERIQARRTELQASLPEELTDGGILIALRFPDGTKAQRRFAETEATAVIFNWVDAVFEHERETIQLQTLNGAQTITYQEQGEQQLSETTVGKKAIAFRVLMVELQQQESDLKGESS